MTHPRDSSSSGGKSRRTGIGAALVVFILLVCGWAYVASRPGSTRPQASQAGNDSPSATGRKASSRPAAITPAITPATAPAAKPWTPPKFTERRRERNAMVAAIRRYGLKDKAVLATMAAVPRHKFVTKRHLSSAYRDTPLPIGYGQTISQPYMVAAMTRYLKLKRNSRVLEIGTGSGYQAAVLAHFTPHVYTIEIVKPLADAVDKRLKRLGYSVVRTRHGDGYYGWPGMKFDAIIVTCAAGQIPPPLLKQLAVGGRMVIPVGRPASTQSLILVEKGKDGKVRSRNLMAVRFVPLVRKSRYSR